MKTGIEIIADERRRQIEVKGWTTEHDVQHTNNELGRAAACYAAMPINIYEHDIILDGHAFVELWPFDKEYYKPCPENRIHELAKAGALIAAEIDRLINASINSVNYDFYNEIDNINYESDNRRLDI